ncbi:MAG: 4'-phosphopantetheinyl transferase superfamily protein [Actinomycetales bacterium]|nr:4'-phosphopantetheinyl transferase superfamily protein [Actinomycetales bacterium]
MPTDGGERVPEQAVEAGGGARCTVHVARVGREWDAASAEALSPAEQQRAARYRDDRARAQFVTGAILLRHAAGAALGVPADGVAVDRTCDRCGKQHGRPRLPGTGLEASVSHSGGLVLVAVSTGPAVGVDVEEVALRPGLDPLALAARTCSQDERRHISDVRGFVTYWTRKEAVLKATGEGLRVPLTDVVVTPPHEPAGLVAWRGRLRPECRMLDLDVGAHHVAALALLTQEPVAVLVDRPD